VASLLGVSLFWQPFHVILILFGMQLWMSNVANKLLSLSLSLNCSNECNWKSVTAHPMHNCWTSFNMSYMPLAACQHSFSNPIYMIVECWSSLNNPLITVSYNFYRFMLQAMERWCHRMTSVRLSVRPSVRLSVTLMDADHIRLARWNFITRLIRPMSSLAARKISAI